MKNLLKKFMFTKKVGAPARSEILTPHDKLYEQTIVWKAHIGTNCINM